MLFEIVLPFEALPADLAGERQFGTFVSPFVDHQIVGLVESSLAVFADKLALSTHLPSELSTAHIIDLHYSVHGGFILCLISTVRMIKNEVFREALANRKFRDRSHRPGVCTYVRMRHCVLNISRMRTRITLQELVKDISQFLRRSEQAREVTRKPKLPTALLV